VPLPRRMWAGGRFDFRAPVRVGDQVSRTSTIESVTTKTGRSGTLVEAVHGEQGFLRGVLRGLAQERLRRGIGDGPVFQLMASADGRLSRNAFAP